MNCVHLLGRCAGDNHSTAFWRCWVLGWFPSVMWQSHVNRIYNKHQVLDSLSTTYFRNNIWCTLLLGVDHNNQSPMFSGFPMFPGIAWLRDTRVPPNELGRNTNENRLLGIKRMGCFSHGNNQLLMGCTSFHGM